MTKGFCLWKRKGNGYTTECGNAYIGTFSYGKFTFCPFCKGYVISEYRKKTGKAYTEKELMK